MSANVPISSSATNPSPIPPPIIAPVLGPIIFAPYLDKLKYLFACFAWSALCANFFPIDVPAFIPRAAPPIATGAIWVIAWTTLPTVLASASSSKGFTSSNHSSTSFALSVSPIKSYNSAPKDTNPFGIFHTPVATPAKADSKKPTFSSLGLEP